MFVVVLLTESCLGLLVTFVEHPRPYGAKDGHSVVRVVVWQRFSSFVLLFDRICELGVADEELTYAPLSRSDRWLEELVGERLVNVIALRLVLAVSKIDLNFLYPMLEFSTKTLGAEYYNAPYL